MDELLLLSPGDLVATSGVGYSDIVYLANGRTVVIEGMLMAGPNDTLLISDPGSVTGCSLEEPAATVALVEPSPALRLLPRPSPVRLIGLFEYGFHLDEHRTATYIRLRQARPATRSDSVPLSQRGTQGDS